MEQKKRLEMEFGSDKGDLIMQYLKIAYQAEENPTDVEVQGVTYKVLRREHVIAFYDADGNTLFDVPKEQMEREYQMVMETPTEEEPTSMIGKTILGIERQAFESVVKNDDVKQRALEKLENGMDKNNPSDMLLLQYLTKRIEESASLADDICQEHKTVKACHQYILRQARMMANGRSGAYYVCDETVGEWAEDYFHKDDKAEEEAKAKEVKEKAKAAKEREKKEKEDQKKRIDRMKKYREAKEENVQEAKKMLKKKARVAESEESVKGETSKLKPESKPRKSNEDMEGQLDMFAFMGIS